MKVRINDVECRRYKATKVDEIFYEIIMWKENPMYGKEKEYRDRGYVDSFSGDFLRSPLGGHQVQKSLFASKESCYTIATLHLNHKEPDIDLKSVGSRLLDLSKEEQADFFEVYALANQRINKKHFRDEE